jgi:hypothetical protein
VAGWYRSSLESKHGVRLDAPYATFSWLWTFPMLLLHLARERNPFFFPPGFVGFRLLAVKARYESELSLPPREWECGEMCVMGWVNVWMRWVKTWWTIIKHWWTCIGNLQPYKGLLLYPCIPLTTKHTQSIGWELGLVQIVLKDIWQIWMPLTVTAMEIRRNRWSCSCAQVWMRRWSLRLL